MYSFALLATIASPLAPGPWPATGFLIPLVIALGTRIHDEEQMLEQELEGYGAYVGRLVLGSSRTSGERKRAKETSEPARSTRPVSDVKSEGVPSTGP